MGHRTAAGTGSSVTAGLALCGGGGQLGCSRRRLVVTEGGAMTEIEYRLLQNQIFIMTHLQDIVGRKQDLEVAIHASEKMLTAYHLRRDPEIAQAVF
jgi:hypothetical protein